MTMLANPLVPTEPYASVAKAREAIHQTLLGFGYVLRHESECGSRYYLGKESHQYRVADHPANAKTRNYMANYAKWFAGGYSEIRLDQPPYIAEAIPEPKSTADFEDRIEAPRWMDPPKPDIYRDVPETIYHSWNCASNSRMNKLNEGPEELAWDMRQVMEPTEAMRLGTYTHTAAWEPSLLSTRHRIFDGSLRSDTQKRRWRSMIEEVGVGNIIRQSQADIAARMITSLHSHKSAASIIESCTDRELSVVSDLRGIRFKSKLDGLASELCGGLVVDLKTGRDVSEWAFKRAVYDKGYHRQGGGYRANLREHGIEVQGFVILAVQNCPPYKTRVYTLLPDVLDAGEQDLYRLIDNYKRRIEANDWSGDGGRAQDLDLSSFAWRELNNQEQHLRETP